MEFESFVETTRELRDLEAVMGALSWDQETMMPGKASPHRARQVSLLASIHHRKLTDPAFGDAIQALREQDLGPWETAGVREAWRAYDRACRLPESLVRELAEHASLSMPTWVEARSKSDFSLFAPQLKRTVDLKRQQADCLGGGDCRYDALLDDYEPGMSVTQLDPLFAQLRPQLTDLLQRILHSPKQPREDILEGVFPARDQEAFGREVATAMGFDWESGRLDVSAHPFCSGLTPLDVRITTRYSENHFASSLFGIVHEAGHGLYEQGLNLERFGNPAAEPISLGLHESQSRLWENCVARSVSFWTFWLPRLKAVFPGQFDCSLEDFIHAVNKIEAGFIRVEADEVSYGLHVILRYEIEKALLEGTLEVDGLDDEWNRRMVEYLGVRPPNAAQGVLQDVHWAHGLVGYFPTYLLGTLYASQFFAAAERAIPDLTSLIERGQMLELREWLRTNIHDRGRVDPADALIRDVTGEPLDAGFFLRHLQEKYGALYAL